MSAPQLQRAALWYARHDWPVFPLRPRTKEPFAGLGVYRATTDPEQVASWWEWQPEANIGFHAGPAGVLTLDLDKYKECFELNGLLSFEDRETVTNQTGGGGEHLLYAIPDGAHYGNGTGALPEGIDVRCFGGYIVVPPSIHPNGRGYNWVFGYGPHEHALLPLPGWLKGILDAATPWRRADACPSDTEAVNVAVALVESVLDAAGVDYGGRCEWGNGRKWVFRNCPFAPPANPHMVDRAAFAVVLPDGRISAGCQHNRCRARLRELHTTGWRYLKRMAVTSDD